MLKRCNICSSEKCVSEFNFHSRSKDGLQYQCRECERSYKNRKYAAYSDYISKVKSVPCMDCGGEFPSYVMDFDHRNRSEKLFDIGRVGKSASLEKLQAEIAKCDVICANCHRVRTWSGNGKDCLSDG